MSADEAGADAPELYEEIIFESPTVSSEFGVVIGDLQTLYSYFSRLREGDITNPRAEEIFSEFAERVVYENLSKDEIEMYIGRLTSAGAFRDISRRAEFYQNDPRFQFEITAIEEGSIVLIVGGTLVLGAVIAIAFAKPGEPTTTEDVHSRHTASDVETLSQNTAAVTGRSGDEETAAVLGDD